MEYIKREDMDFAIWAQDEAHIPYGAQHDSPSVCEDSIDTPIDEHYQPVDSMFGQGYPSQCVDQAPTQSWGTAVGVSRFSRLSFSLSNRAPLPVLPSPTAGQLYARVAPNFLAFRCVPRQSDVGVHAGTCPDAVDD